MVCQWRFFPICLCEIIEGQGACTEHSRTSEGDFFSLYYTVLEQLTHVILAIGQWFSIWLQPSCVLDIPSKNQTWQGNKGSEEKNILGKLYQFTNLK